jgi:hypothetical protein
MVDGSTTLPCKLVRIARISYKVKNNKKAMSERQHNFSAVLINSFYLQYLVK